VYIVRYSSRKVAKIHNVGQFVDYKFINLPKKMLAIEKRLR